MIFIAESTYNKFNLKGNQFLVFVEVLLAAGR